MSKENGEETYSGIDSEWAERQRDAHMRLLMSQMPAIMWTVDRELRFTSGYGTGLTDLGVSAGDVVGMSMREYFQTDDPDFLPIAMHHRALQGESAAYQFELQNHLYECRLEPLRAPDGGIIGVMGVALDVAPRRREQEALSLTDLLLRQLLELLPVGVVIMGTDGQFRYINPAVERMLGYSSEEIMRLGVPALHHPDDFLSDAPLYGEMYAGLRDHYQIEKRYIRKDGQLFRGRLTASLVRGTASRDHYILGILELLDASPQAAEPPRNQAGSPLEGRTAQALLHGATRLLDQIRGETLAPAPADQGDELAQLVRPEVHPDLHKLSPRELQILHALLINQRVAVIAETLRISRHTVRNHLKSIFQKLGVRSQTELLVRLLQKPDR